MLAVARQIGVFLLKLTLLRIDVIIKYLNRSLIIHNMIVYLAVSHSRDRRKAPPHREGVYGLT